MFESIKNLFKPGFTCKKCGASLGSTLATEYEMCSDCMLELDAYVKNMQKNISVCQTKANQAGQDGDFEHQVYYLGQLLECLVEYKETYVDVGIDILQQDIFALITQIQTAYDETIANRDSHRKTYVYQVIKKNEIIQGSERQWDDICAEQAEAVAAIFDCLQAYENDDSWMAPKGCIKSELLTFWTNLFTFLAEENGSVSDARRELIVKRLGLIAEYRADVLAAEKYISENNEFLAMVPSWLEAVRLGDLKLKGVGSDSQFSLTLLKIFKLSSLSFCMELPITSDANKLTSLYGFFHLMNKHLASYGLRTIELNEFEEKEMPFAARGKTVEKSDSHVNGLTDLINKLNELVGLSQVKSEINGLVNLIKIRKIREERNLTQPDMTLHLVFSGNPGTGKTTVARMLSQIYKELGILSKGHLIETDRAGLVAGYVGQTALKTKAVLESADGGILFIDEAYSLTQSKDDADYGKEAIDTIVKHMEDNRDDFVLVVAGYPEPMQEFLDSNPGLRSRFNNFIQFEDYTPEELILILNSMCKKASLFLSQQAEDFSRAFFVKRCALQLDSFANARDVRNFFEKAIANQANRLAALDTISDQSLSEIEYDDVNDIVFSDCP